jgi:hypothetical protein
MSNSLGSYIYNLYIKQIYDKETKTNKDVSIATQFFIGLIIVGCIIKLLSNSLSGASGFSAASGTIWGYLLVLCAILGFIILTVDTTTDNTIKQFNIPWYLFGLIGIILWVLYLNISFYKQINRNNIPPVYNMWDSWSTIFIIMITLIILIQYNSESVNNTSDNNKKIFNVLIGFILFLNIIIVGIQHTILQNFSVDG